RDTDTNRFIVRLVDDTGHSQYLATCPLAFSGLDGAAGIDGIAGAGNAPDGSATGMQSAQPYVMIDTQNTTIVTSRAAGTNGGVSGYAAGVAWVNPVQVVQWEITTAAGTPGDPEPAQDQVLAGTPLAPGTLDPTKFDLMRTYYDALGNAVTDTSEIVAEYAVDLAFAFTVDTSTISTLPNVVSYGFEDPADNDKWAYQDVQTQGAAWTTGPQRIRAVRARLATRTSQTDRAVNIPVTNYGSQAFMYRYQIDATDYARVRTMVTQVALPNQQRNFY
ncbi:MAG: hypothetical protein ABSD03_17210, partial [Vulcanimicrobiaceae bacterium]